MKTTKRDCERIYRNYYEDWQIKGIFLRREDNS